MIQGPTTRDLERHLGANPSSPLFARFAETLLKQGEIARAESLCERGVAHYPHYTTGHLLYARCLAAGGRYAGAIEVLNDLLPGYPGNILLGRLGEEWEERLAAEMFAGGAGSSADDGMVAAGGGMVHPDGGMAVAGTGTGAPDGPAWTTGEGSVSDDMNGVDETPAVTRSTEPVPAAARVTVSPDIPASAPPNQAGGAMGKREDPGPGPLTAWPSAFRQEETKPAAIGEAGVSDLQAPDAPDEFSGDGVSPPMPVPSITAGPVPILQPVPPFRKPSGFIEADRIVSRTLAEIYASQGAVGEAVETYRILLDRMPERRESLEGRLRELEERLRGNPG
jgi:tetratricopeptide (TPR) repeat protein